jgi:hypothetical protein
MASGKKDKKRTTPDPGTTLFVFYVGFVMLITFLAMFVDVHAGTENQSFCGNRSYVAFEHLIPITEYPLPAGHHVPRNGDAPAL